MSDRKEIREVAVYVLESDLLMRQILCSMLRKETGICLNCLKSFDDFETVFESLKENQPHLLMLGVDEMDSPEMKFFYHVRQELPDIHIVLLTPLTREGAYIALEGLKKGAVDYVTKPDKRNGLILASNHFHKRVLPVVKAVPRLNRIRKASGKKVSDDRKITESLTMAHQRMIPNGIDLIVIGSCLGGVTSLYKIIAGLPEKLPAPVVIVQHMPKIYTEVLAEELDETTLLNVREAKQNSVLIPGQIYVAPGGYHSVIKSNGERKKIVLHRGPREHKCRPSIDVLLRSALQNYDSRVLSVFLSGGGADGIQGASLVLAKGGKVLLESKESSLLWDLNEKIYGLRPGIKSVPAERLASEILKQLHPENLKKGLPGIPGEAAKDDWMVRTLGD